MNRSVVIRAAAGLAAYLNKNGHTNGLVVIGYDARHESEDFARDTAAVMTGAGLRAALLPRPLPTPVLAFAIRHLGAVAGVEVTASHNPPRDNGYKVYLGDGSQIVPPADADIAAEIAAIPSLTTVSRPTEGWETLDDSVLDAYLARTDAVLSPGSPRTARTVYTAMHGVGKDTLLAAFARKASPPRTSSPSRPTRTRTSPPWPSPTRRSPARWTSPSRRPARRTPTWSSPTTRTRTAAPWRSRTTAAGACSAATRWARCSPPTW
ncbi:Phosphomannomutase OS=Streptomyces glaucescens OX=1907 GN=SGLAU_21180 PE=3 SV=1 [Streptomyces glaucescens]